MTAAKRLIEIDETTAVTLDRRAAERGVSVSDLIAEMTASEDESSALSEDEISELDRRWARVEAGEATVSHDEVVKWLRTWGTPAFKPWNSR
jgi:predicted transcriptional regulator